MDNALNINFLTLDEFARLPAVNHRIALGYDAQDYHLTGRAYESSQATIKTGTTTDLPEPTYSSYAADTNIGILIANGNSLHSHMMYNFGALAQKGSKSSDKVISEFRERIEDFFGHIDSLIQQGKVTESITFDHVGSGGLAEVLSNRIREQSRVVTSTQLKEAFEDIIERRLAKTEELATARDIEVNYSRSMFWGQRLIDRKQSPNGKDLIPWTNMHYDPKSHTLSINARKASLKRFRTPSIIKFPVPNTAEYIAHHYSELELGPDHRSDKAEAAIDQKEDYWDKPCDNRERNDLRQSEDSDTTLVDIEKPKENGDLADRNFYCIKDVDMTHYGQNYKFDLFTTRDIFTYEDLKYYKNRPETLDLIKQIDDDGFVERGGVVRIARDCVNRILEQPHRRHFVKEESKDALRLMHKVAQDGKKVVVVRGHGGTMKNFFGKKAWCVVGHDRSISDVSLLANQLSKKYGDELGAIYIQVCNEDGIPIDMGNLNTYHYNGAISSSTSVPVIAPLNISDGVSQGRASVDVRTYFPYTTAS